MESEAKGGRILSVTADEEAQCAVRESLEPLALRAEEAGSAREALERMEEEAPDLLLLDLVLPDVTGLGVCRLVREHSRLAELPIVVVSAHASEIDRVLAFECGADDFLRRPFYGRELASRVRAVLRRGAPVPRAAAQSATGSHGLLRLDPERGVVEVAGERVELTARELSVLATLVRQRGKVLPRSRIQQLTTGSESEEQSRVIDAHVKSIRRKLGPARDYVQTVRGVGYRFAVTESAPARHAPQRAAPSAREPESGPREARGL